MRSEGNAWKIENQQLVSPLLQCSSTPVSFGQGFRSLECDSNGWFPILNTLLTWLQLTFPRALNWNQHATDIINPLTPELNLSVQRCQTIFFTGDFAYWTVNFVNICVKNQQIYQLFIQFINYVW
jgi:hypothetical protein